MKRFDFLLPLILAASAGAQPPVHEAGAVRPPLIAERTDGARDAIRASTSRATMHERPLVSSASPTSHSVASSPPNNAGSELAGNGGTAAVRTPPFSIHPAARVPTDPADSLYRLAVTTLNRGEYQRAEDLFSQLSETFPRSVYAPDSYYYRAVALQRTGGTKELRTAVLLLDTLQLRFTTLNAQRDVGALRARLLGELAAKGDQAARSAVELKAYLQLQNCSRDALAAAAGALNALSNVNPDSATAALRAVLKRRDDCSLSLRQSSLLLVSKQNTETQLSILSDVSRNDAAVTVRREAVSWLGKVPDDRAVQILADLIRSRQDSAVHLAALRAMEQHPSPVARDELTRIASELPPGTTRTAIVTSLRDRRLRTAIVWRSSTSNITENGWPGRGWPADVGAWMARPLSLSYSLSSGNLATARDAKQTLEKRRSAIRALAPASAARVEQIIELFDATRESPLRIEIVELLGARGQPEASDKLASIVRDLAENSAVRRAGVLALARKTDSHSQKLLMEIISR